MVSQFRAADVQWSYICYCQVINKTLVSILYLFQKFPKWLFDYLFYGLLYHQSELVFLVCQRIQFHSKTNKKTCMYISCLNILLKYNQPTDILWSLFCSETSIRLYVFIKWMILLYYDLLFIGNMGYPILFIFSLLLQVAFLYGKKYRTSYPFQ